MSQFAFGPGSMWAISNASNPTPVQFGVSQAISVDLASTTKALFGQYQLPVTTAQGELKVSGKCTFAQFNGRLISQFFGVSKTTGQILTASAESGTIGTTPYQVTVANSANWTTDLGVVFAATGLALTRVASSPATGQYSVAAGVYTFAAADTTKSVYISYVYTAASTGETITITNQLQGIANNFKTVISMPYNGQQANFTLNSCFQKSLKFATKQGDFVMPDYEFDVACDASNTLGTISVAEAS